MMNNRSSTSYVRILVILSVSALLMEYIVDLPGGRPAVFFDPIVILLLVIITILLIAIEAYTRSLNKIIYAMMSDEQREVLIAKNKTRNQNLWYKKLMQRLTKNKPIAQEGSIELNHSYDGIRELDNALPPWWVYLFYITILFSVIYLVRFHIFEGDTQLEEYKKEMVIAQRDLEEYKKTAKDFIDADNVTLLTDASDLDAGKTVFKNNCVACHMADGGGGIGPNLADKYWILGGGIKKIYHTISEGGRDGKGMIPWKQSLKPIEMAQVSSYVISLQGSIPANPKDPQGEEIWEKEE